MLGQQPGFQSYDEIGLIHRLRGLSKTYLFISFLSPLLHFYPLDLKDQTQST